MTDDCPLLGQASEEIAAPPEEVFEALLDPQALAEWFLPPGDGATQDWRVDMLPGGAWRARTIAPDGVEGELSGELVTLDAPRVLELRWHVGPGLPPGSTVRYDLEPIWLHGDRGTRLTVTHVSGSPLPSRVTMQGTATTTIDWHARLAALAELFVTSTSY
ncbi:MAG: SRPBCC domain-containing protein [Gemmatimonadota bacterium]